MKKLLPYLLALAFIRAGVFGALYVKNHSSNVKIETNLAETQSDMEKADQTVFVLVVDSSANSKAIEPMFQKTARDLKGQALFLEVDVAKIPEAAGKVMPYVLILNKSAGVVARLVGSPESQQVMEDALKRVVSEINQIKASKTP